VIDMTDCGCPEGYPRDSCYCWVRKFPKKLSNYEKALLVLKEGVHREGETVIDLQTANAMKTIYEAVNDENKKKFNKIDFIVLAHKSWDIIGCAKVK